MMNLNNKKEATNTSAGYASAGKVSEANKSWELTLGLSWPVGGGRGGGVPVLVEQGVTRESDEHGDDGTSRDAVVLVVQHLHVALHADGRDGGERRHHVAVLAVLQLTHQVAPVAVLQLAELLEVAYGALQCQRRGQWTGGAHRGTKCKDTTMRYLLKRGA